MQKSSFNIVSLVVIVVLLGALTFALYPVLTSCRIIAHPVAIGSRGRDIYVAITGANAEREPLGLGSVWPRDSPLSTNTVEKVAISDMTFSNSTDYFWKLYDGDNLGTEAHSPYIAGFDFSKLAGAGVPVYSGSGQLRPENNMWTIASNVRDEMVDIIPILVTRNLAAESLARDVTDSMLERRLYFDDYWKTPFEERSAVIIRKGGSVFKIRPKNLSYAHVYRQQSFTTTLEGGAILGYLTPNRRVLLSESAYQKCATSGDNPKKDYHYYSVKEAVAQSKSFVDEIKEGVPFFIVVGLVVAVFLFVRSLYIIDLRVALLSVGIPYCILLWLSISSYMTSYILGVLRFKYSLVMILIALLVHVLNLMYLRVWKLRTKEVVLFQKALWPAVSAPIVAVVFSLVGVAVFAIIERFF